MKISRIAAPLLGGALIFAACAGVRPVVPVPQARLPVPAPAPVSKPAASGDYLPDGVLLAGLRAFSWQGDLYRVPFHTVKVITPASAATKGEAEVHGTGKVEGAAGDRFWTAYVAASRPAKKEDLKPGVLVFAMGDASPRSREDLARNTVWGLFRVKDVSNLYKGTVILEYNDTYWNKWVNVEYHMDNIRLVLGEFSPELKQ